MSIQATEAELAVPVNTETGEPFLYTMEVGDRLVHADTNEELVAAILGEETGREVTYVDETLDEARESRAPYGAPDWEVAGWISTYTAVAVGEHEQVTRDVETLTGHPATSLRDVVRSAAGTP